LTVTAMRNSWPILRQVEVTYSSDTSVEFHRITRCYIPDNRILYIVTNMTIARQRIKQNNTRTVGDGDLYSVRLEVSSVQESSFVRKSVIRHS
jgi:CRISPR/Cas system CMR subunit Cmr4 (Cas7 group RAMP superfamily)